MSVYEDAKKAIQDFVAPEIRALAERMKRLEEKIDANHREVMTALNLDKRMAIIEDRQQRKETQN